MRNKFSKIVLAATLGLALAFTFSCSSDDNGTKEPTYFYSMYGIKNSSGLAFETLMSIPAPTNPSFKDIENMWSRIRQLNCDFLESGRVSESDGRNVLSQHDFSPKDIDNVIKQLNARGNVILNFDPTDPQTYYVIVWYLERE